MIMYLHLVLSYLSYLMSVLISKSSPLNSFIEQSTSVIDEALTYLPNMVRDFCRQNVNESDVRSLEICVRKKASTCICAPTIFSSSIIKFHINLQIYHLRNPFEVSLTICKNELLKKKTQSTFK